MLGQALAYLTLAHYNQIHYLKNWKYKNNSLLMLLIESGFKKEVEFLATQIMLFGKTKTCRCLDD